MDFEWDEKKRAVNLVEHGLDLIDGDAEERKYRTIFG